MSEPKTITSKIRKIRELRGYSQEYMAIQLELSQRQYQRLETGESEITLTKLGEICKVLEISLAQLLGFDERLIIQNCGTGVGSAMTVNNNLPEILVSQYQERIAHLEEEVRFLRNLFESSQKGNS